MTKFVKTFESFHGNQSELDREREDLIKRGEYKIYIGKIGDIARFFSNLTSEAAPYAHRMGKNENEVRILFPKDMDIVFELQDVAEECNLTPLDVNSVQI